MTFFYLLNGRDFFLTSLTVLVLLLVKNVVIVNNAIIVVVRFLLWRWSSSSNSTFSSWSNSHTHTLTHTYATICSSLRRYLLLFVYLVIELNYSFPLFFCLRLVVVFSIIVIIVDDLTWLDTTRRLDSTAEYTGQLYWLFEWYEN